MAEFKGLSRKPFPLLLTDADGDEREYMLHRLTLQDLADYEEKHGEFREMKSHGISGLITLLWLSLRTGYPEITERQAGELVTLDRMDVLMEAIDLTMPGDKEQVGVKCPACSHRFPFDPKTDSQPLAPEEVAEEASPEA
jgi:hypothetical protein